MWVDKRQDFFMRYEGMTVGSIRLQTLPEGSRYVWSITINEHVPQVEGVPISGSAMTLDEAETQFNRTYEAMRSKAGLPKPQG